MVVRWRWTVVVVVFCFIRLRLIYISMCNTMCVILFRAWPREYLRGIFLFLFLHIFIENCVHSFHKIIMINTLHRVWAKLIWRNALLLLLYDLFVLAMWWSSNVLLLAAAVALVVCTARHGTLEIYNEIVIHFKMALYDMRACIARIIIWAIFPSANFPPGVCVCERVHEP